MDKEIKIYIQGLMTEGTIVRERTIVAYSQYSLLQKCLKACLEIVQDIRVDTLVFIDAYGTEQYCDAKFFREGEFER